MRGVFGGTGIGGLRSFESLVNKPHGEMSKAFWNEF